MSKWIWGTHLKLTKGQRRWGYGKGKNWKESVRKGRKIGWTTIKTLGQIR